MTERMAPEGGALNLWGVLVRWCWPDKHQVWTHDIDDRQAWAEEQARQLVDLLWGALAGRDLTVNELLAELKAEGGEEAEHDCDREYRSDCPRCNGVSAEEAGHW